MELTKPLALRAGDRVAVCAPCGPVSEEALGAGLNILGQRYRVTCDPDLPHRRLGYLAGTDQQRIEEFHAALKDPDIRAIFCARGGYGALRLVRLIDPTMLAADPKPVCGFSDVTVLLHLILNAGVAPIHGPVVTQLGRLSGDDLKHLYRLLEDPDYRPVYLGKPWIMAADREPVQRGVLWGGNLSVLTGLTGTGTLHTPKQAILALEEVAEPPYRLDRMLTQLHLSGHLEQVNAVALGRILVRGSSHENPTGSKSDPELDATIAERLNSWGLPAVRSMPWGHGRAMRAWPMGAAATLNLEDGRMQIEESSVSAG